MDTPLVIFALIAVVAMGMMVFADSAVTGQGISIDRLTPEMAKKLADSLEKKQNPPPSNTGPVCDCPSYGDKILTVKQGSIMFTGLSKWDCMLVDEIIKLRKELKKSNVHLLQWDDACKTYGW